MHLEKNWTSEQTDLTPLEINFRYMLKTIKTASTKVIMSKKAIIWGCPVTFDHLWKIRAPLNIVEGFDLSHFDEVIMNACNIRWLHLCYLMVQNRILIKFKTNLFLFYSHFLFLRIDFRNNITTSWKMNIFSEFFKIINKCLMRIPLASVSLTRFQSWNIIKTKFTSLW